MTEIWRSGNYVSVAVIDLPDETLEHWCGRSLLRGVEAGLGGWIGCGRFLPSGAQVQFIRHLAAPGVPGYEIRCDAACDPDQVLAETLATLGVSWQCVNWARPGVGQPSSAGA